MLPYWILFALVAAGASFERIRVNTLHRYTPALILLLLGLTAMIGFRFEVGGDWNAYALMFEYGGRRTLEFALERGDPGYQTLGWLVARAGYDIWVVNLVCGLLFSWGLIQLARNQPAPWLSVLVAVPYLIVVVAMGYSRQAVAIGFIMAGLASVERGAGVVRFAIFVGLAALFHRTAIIALPIVMFAGNRNYLVNIVAGVLLTFALYTALLADTMETFVANYIEAEYQSQGAAIRVAMSVVPAALMLWRGKDMHFGDFQYRLWRLIALVALALVPALLLSPSSTAVDRLALYILPIQIVVLPRLVLLMAKPSTARAIVIFYSALTLAVWLNFAVHAQRWIPYQVYPFGENVPLVRGFRR